MANINAEQVIQTKVQGVLASTPYAASSLTKLTGGTGNFLFHASLQNAPPDCADGVVVKQGEAYVASSPNFPLSTSRCAVEEEALVYLNALPPSNSPACIITTPKLYYYNPGTFTQVQEYLPNAVNLKTYALEHFKAPTSESHKQPCQQLGHALGVWLRSFHDWSQRPDQNRLRNIIAKNKEMQQLKLWVNYQVVAGMADSYPDILGDVKEELVEIHKMAVAELENKNTLHAIHGDFWTGNVLLPNAPLEDGKQIPIKIIDWELSQLAIRPLDLGQMIAELWQLKLYKDIDAGEWLIESFVDGYGDFDEDFAFRVILHVGIHLICFGSRTPGWGTKEQNIDLVRTGKEVVSKAWRKDRQGFDGHILSCLLEKATKTSH